MIVSILSDFGLSEEYVAAMKGVILSIVPDVAFLDIAHDLPPWQLAKAALVLAAAVPFAPVGVHLAVVDPGVGTARRALALRAARGDFLVGPDNGLLVPAAGRLGGTVAAVSLENPEYMRHPVHATFHGRDIFAPAAGHLARGVPLAELGPSLEPAALAPAPFEEAQVGAGALYCRVIDADRFGSLRLSATWDQFAQAGLASEPGLTVDIADSLYDCPIRTTFAEGVASNELFLYHDSSGQVGLAANLARADELTGASPGTAVILYH